MCELCLAGNSGPTWAASVHLIEDWRRLQGWRSGRRLELDRRLQISRRCQIFCHVGYSSVFMHAWAAKPMNHWLFSPLFIGSKLTENGAKMSITVSHASKKMSNEDTFRYLVLLQDTVGNAVKVQEDRELCFLLKWRGEREQQKSLNRLLICVWEWKERW